MLEGRENKALMASTSSEKCKSCSNLRDPFVQPLLVEEGAEASRRKGCSPGSRKSPNSPSDGFPQAPTALGSTNMDRSAVHSTSKFRHNEARYLALISSPNFPFSLFHCVQVPLSGPMSCDLDRAQMLNQSSEENRSVEIKRDNSSVETLLCL